MKKTPLLIASLTYVFLTGCQDNNTNQLFTIQPKTSSYYTSISSGSNGPAFQLLTVYNNTSKPLTISNISFTNPNSSITIAARSTALNQPDLLYGTLPQCSTQTSTSTITTTVNTLQPGQTCGILLQGFTYDPRQAVQTAALNVGVSGDSTAFQKTFNLTDVTHIYASLYANKMGTVTVPANDFVLADCSNSTNTAGSPLTCVNALGTNQNDNFLNSNASEIRVFPNGNLIFGGEITQAGAFQAPSSTASSAAIICQTDSDQCQNALADGTYFGPQVDGTGFISEIELDHATKDTTFFVTGKFSNIMQGSQIIASGTGAYPYFVAYCTIGGSCINIMPGQSVSNPNNTGDSGIYGLAYAPKENTIYFAGTFSNFTGTTNPGNTFPIIACSLNSNNIASSYTNYFSSSSNDSSGHIFGLSAATIGGQDELQVNTAAQSIGGQTTPSGSLAALCTTTGCIKTVTAPNGITLRGAYDAHPAAEGGLFYIATNSTSLGNANSTDNGGNGGGFLPACLGNDLSTCFDVLGGGTNGAFNHGVYPTYVDNGVTNVPSIVANVGAQLSMTAGS